MCGIAGFFNPKADYSSNQEKYRVILKNMRDTLIHRGPDEQGGYLGKCAGLAHRRLSIRDIKGGKQPMSRRRGAYSYQIVYNGEIYNCEEIKKNLIKKGWRFETTSDTEVLLLAFLEYGPEFITKINGIYALAILDEKHNQLYLYRDYFGVKPLFYMRKEETIVFASEPKGIFAFPGIQAKLNTKGLCEILGMGPARIPGSGVFQGMQEVKPGHFLCVNMYGITDRCFWHLESKPHEDDYETTLKKTRELVTQVIEKQMVSDVPVCTFLSGGVDSSLVSAICANKLRREGERLTTYSFDFVGNDKYFKANSFQPSEDRPYVDAMVKYLGSKHHYLECDIKTQADLLYDSVRAHDLPCMVDVDSSLLHFCKLVGEKEKVVLTGECADEVFAGYPWFHREEFLNCNTFPWTPDLSPRKSLLKKELVEELNMDCFVNEAYEAALREMVILPGESKEEAKRRYISYLNIRYFMQTLLNRMDRTSMHSGLEARVPFADRDLVQYIYNVPFEMKAKNGVVKNVLRQAARGILPDEILFRKKSPYPKSYNPYYEQLLGKRLLEIMEDEGAPILQLVDKEKLTAFIHSVKDYGKPWYGQLMAGPQMLAYLLQINYWISHYHIQMNI